MAVTLSLQAVCSRAQASLAQQGLMLWMPQGLVLLAPQTPGVLEVILLVAAAAALAAGMLCSRLAAMAAMRLTSQT
jgi:hypothetical protein